MIRQGDCCGPWLLIPGPPWWNARTQRLSPLASTLVTQSTILCYYQVGRWPKAQAQAFFF